MTKFVIYRDVAGGYRWRLLAGNGEKVAASESYTTKYAAQVSAENMKRWSYSAVIVDSTV